MSIFENMNAKEIAICLSAFYEAAKKYTPAQLYGTQVYLPNREKPINIDRSDYDEGIKILLEDYEVFWTPDTKPDDLKWKINKRRMKELDEHIRKNTYIDTDHVLKRFAASEHFEDELAMLLGLPFGSGRKDLYDAIAKLKDERNKLHELKKLHRVIENSWYGASSGVAFGPGCVVTGNDYLYRRELGLPDNATVADILGRIRDIKEANENQAKHASKLVQSIIDVAKERDEADRLRRHWHSKYEEEHKECVRLSKLHAADKEKKDEQDAKIREFSDQNTTLEYSVAALKKRIRSMEAEAAEKETKTKVITDTLRGNLVDSVEECKKLNGRIRLLEDQLKRNGVPPLEDPLDPGF